MNYIDIVTKLFTFDTMPRKYQYRTVDKLPDNAVKVKDYAVKIRNCSTSLIYHELQRNKANFEIIQFQGINFVIPLH